METPQPDDLSDLERQLSAWRPSADGLAADAMLFAAGRASARAGKRRYFWPTATACIAALAAALGGWLASERAERLALARQLQDRQHAAEPAPVPAPDQARQPSPDSLLAARLSLQRDFEAWLASAGGSPRPPQGAAVTDRPVLRARQPVDKLDQ